MPREEGTRIERFFISLKSREMKKPLIHNVSGDAADLKNPSPVTHNDCQQHNTARVIDSAKAMSIVGTVMIITGFVLLLLFVAWLEK